MNTGPLESFQALRTAAARMPEPAESTAVTIGLVSESSPPFLVTALEAEARRRGFHWRVRGEATEEVSGGLLALRGVEDEAAERPDYIIVIPAVEALFEQFLALPATERARFGRERAEAWRLARRAWADTGVTLWWATCVPFVDGLHGFGLGIAHSFRRQMLELHDSLLQAATDETNLRLFDLESLAAWHGRETVFDPRWWQEGRLAFALDFLPVLAFHLVNSIEEAAGRVRKVVACDLDDTLWGGILAEDGCDGLEIGPSGTGASFLGLQRWLLALRDRGVLLALCSKNDEAAVLEALESVPGNLLRLHHFAAWRINYAPKSENLRAIAAELKLGLDSFVFLDDQPFERAEVRERCPEVTVPELPMPPEERLPHLQSLNLFVQSASSLADAARARQYTEEAERRGAQSAHADYASYLASLDLQATVEALTKANLDRVLQLSLRSNQFNFRTHRYTRDELTAALEDSRRVWTILTLRDRFGDYGLVAVVEARLDDGGVAEIRNWFMSCRVLQRGMEACTQNCLVERLRAAGARSVRLAFLPTAKNGLVAELPGVLGWQRDGADPAIWRLTLDEFNPLSTPIEVIKP